MALYRPANQKELPKKSAVAQKYSIEPAQKTGIAQKVGSSLLKNETASFDEIVENTANLWRARQK